MIATMLCIIAALLIQPEETPQQLRELLPGIRVADGVVEFGGQIAIDAHHPDTPDVYLEMFITAPDSREHESLIVTDIKPSNLHAALLAAGFESGAPLSRGSDGEPIPAHGDTLVIEVAEEQGNPEFKAITDWVMHVEHKSGIVDDERWAGFVFAGSALTRRGYEADGAGTIASLTSFGNDVIAPTWTVSHLAEIDEPVWIANRELIPKKGTPVTVRIRPQPDSHEPDGVDVDRDP